MVSSGLTKKAEPPPTRGVNRDSGTASANGGWLRRLVRHQRREIHNKIRQIQTLTNRKRRTCTRSGQKCSFSSACNVPTFSMRVKHRSGTLTRQFSAILPPYDDAQPSRDVAFSGVAAFISRSDAIWPPAGIRKPAVADLMRPAQFGHHQ